MGEASGVFEDLLTRVRAKDRRALARLISRKPDEAVGRQIDRDGGKLTVAGVVKDFVYNNIYGAVEPMMIFCDPKAEVTHQLTVRFKPGIDYKAALASVESVVKKFNPTFPFEYSFVSDDFARLFDGESLIGTLAALFAGLAIFICCIGLAGLASFTIEKRFREIGIRKVLGASVQQVLTLISKEFLKLVLIAFVIAVPITWWGMHNWLQKYTYHIDVSIWLFLAVGFIVLLLTLIVVSMNTIRAALANPAKSLRTE